MKKRFLILLGKYVSFGDMMYLADLVIVRVVWKRLPAAKQKKMRNTEFDTPELITDLDV